MQVKAQFEPMDGPRNQRVGRVEGARDGGPRCNWLVASGPASIAWAVRSGENVLAFHTVAPENANAPREPGRERTLAVVGPRLAFETTAGHPDECPHAAAASNDESTRIVKSLSVRAPTP